MPLANQRQLPAQVVGVLHAAVHAMALRGAACVRRVAGQQRAAQAKVLRDLRVAIKAGRVRHAFEARVGQVTAQGLQSVVHQVRLRRTGPQIDAPPTLGQCGQDHGRRIQVGVVGLERIGPSGDGGVEYRPGLVDVVPVLADTHQRAHGAVVAITADDPLGKHLGPDAALLKGCQHAVGALLQPDQLGGASDAAAQGLQMVGQDGFGDFFRNTDIEGVAAAAQRQIDVAQHVAGGVDARAALLDAGIQQRRGDAQSVQDFDGARVDHGGAVPVLRPFVRVDQQAIDAAPKKLRGGEQAGGAGAHHQNGRRDHQAFSSRPAPPMRGRLAKLEQAEGKRQ